MDTQSIRYGSLIAIYWRNIWRIKHPFREYFSICWNNQEIKDFQKQYGVNFTVMEKTEVNGDNADRAWQYLRKQSDLGGAAIPWNFAKFLVNEDGDVVAYYGP